MPFGKPALRHFMFLEHPEGMDLEGAQGIDAPVHEAVPLLAEGDIVPQPQDFATIGHLYRSIEHGLDHLAEKFGERNLFVGPSRAQATSAYFHWPELVPVTYPASAHRAIDDPRAGEGAGRHWQNVHFGQFVRVLDEYRQLKRRTRTSSQRDASSTRPCVRPRTTAPCLGSPTGLRRAAPTCSTSATRFSSRSCTGSSPTPRRPTRSSRPSRARQSR